ncbi:DUF4261 domain-containing protein [Brevibacillus gelatini]|uniref:DUF4261 domain-containing protein n=1 Tax=Brevibacillus gelatini TaxID=1655277 RepID=A0A3M8AM10_9BACL|nr:DUF4261 domain-containing protein [Brevibacillus gelatini]RNB51667.1 DUF4261 domain-containing protein [Brevibacillus gelatini]
MGIPTIILGVPGYWKSRDDFKEAMLRKGNGYIYMGNHIGNLENPDVFFEVDMNEHNPYVTEAFEIAGNGSFSVEDIYDLKNHNSIVYIFGEGGSVDNVMKIMEVASAVLNAGGIAVNVESSGRASTKKDWLEITSSQDITKVFTRIIQMSRDNNTFYTTGMHCFGYPDVVTTYEGNTGKEVATLFRVFCLYNLVEKPKINAGETFSLDSSSPVYLLKHEECTMFESDDPFYNPYGVWRLVRHHRPTS